MLFRSQKRPTLGSGTDDAPSDQQPLKKKKKKSQGITPKVVVGVTPATAAVQDQFDEVRENKVTSPTASTLCPDNARARLESVRRQHFQASCQQALDTVEHELLQV